MKQGYIARPKSIENIDDFENLTIIKNPYIDEMEFPRYIASNKEAKNVPLIHYSYTQYKWFFSDEDNFAEYGCGNTIEDAINNLMQKSNPHER